MVALLPFWLLIRSSWLRLNVHQRASSRRENRVAGENERGAQERSTKEKMTKKRVKERDKDKRKTLARKREARKKKARGEETLILPRDRPRAG